MFDLTATFRDFYQPATTTTIPVPASWPQLVRAAATVGRDVPWATAGVGRSLLRYERAWRIAMMRSCLDEATAGKSNRVVRTLAYQTLDPSEKGAVSFFLGQVTAKYLAEVMFGCVVFAHLDSALRYCGVPVVGTRPDFIGLCADGRTLVVEAKGRSGGLGGVLNTAKSQVSARVKGDLTYAHASYFKGAELRVALQDPESEASDLVDARAVILAYYNPLRELVVNGDDRELGGERYRIGRFADLDVEIGLPVALLSDLEALHREELPAEVFLERGRGRAIADRVEGVAAQRSLLRDESLRSPEAAAPNGLGPELTDERNLIRAASDGDDARPRPRRSERRIRRGRPNPALLKMAAEATEFGAIVADDDSFVALGASWRREEQGDAGSTVEG